MPECMAAARACGASVAADALGLHLDDLWLHLWCAHSIFDVLVPRDEHWRASIMLLAIRLATI